eukprot:TRINITY_DN366_c0_g1_i1.p1 TRINITY_DN366_c0_g1~~TRINITY_DN366_c0_g1_i1.p1  ORF type:complete len:242 (+),score=18.34 TRINITY_DN366_c0_g1_i1:94-819(+)
MLQNQYAFPSFDALPQSVKKEEVCRRVGNHVCWLAEVEEKCLIPPKGMPNRNKLFVKDISGRTGLQVAFYCKESELIHFNFDQIKKGKTIAIRYATQHQFLDRSFGVRVEEIGMVKVYDFSLSDLLKLSQIHINSIKSKRCVVCETETNFKCVCKGVRLCSEDCQRDYHLSHSKGCKFFQEDWHQLVELLVNPPNGCKKIPFVTEAELLSQPIFRGSEVGRSDNEALIDEIVEKGRLGMLF